MPRQSDRCVVIRGPITPREPLEPAEISLAHVDLPGWRFDLALATSGQVTAIAMRWNGDEPPNFKIRRWGLFPPPLSPLVAPDTTDLTARLWRRVPVGELVETARREVLAVRAIAHNVASIGGIDLPRWAPWAASFMKEPRPGRRGRDDRAYAALAAMYVDALGSGHEVKEVARQLHLSRSQVSNLLHEARRRGLLTKSPRGRAGGQLTDRARKVLQQPDNNRI